MLRGGCVPLSPITETLGLNQSVQTKPIVVTATNKDPLSLRQATSYSQRHQWHGGYSGECITLCFCLYLLPLGLHKNGYQIARSDKTDPQHSSQPGPTIRAAVGYYTWCVKRCQCHRTCRGECITLWFCLHLLHCNTTKLLLTQST